MPDTTAHAKRAAVSRYGADITWCAPTLAARESAVQQVLAATGAHLVHPYDDHLVMAGQATVAVEFLEAVPVLDVLLCPVGGGGLISGCAVAAKTLYGGTYTQFDVSFRRLGINTTFVDPEDPENFRRAITPRTWRRTGPSASPASLAPTGPATPSGGSIG